MKASKEHGLSRGTAPMPGSAARWKPPLMLRRTFWRCSAPMETELLCAPHAAHSLSLFTPDPLSVIITIYIYIISSLTDTLTSCNVLCRLQNKYAIYIPAEIQSMTFLSVPSALPVAHPATCTHPGAIRGAARPQRTNRLKPSA